MSTSPTPSAVPDDLREMARRTVDAALADPRMDEANGVEAAMQDAIAAALLQVRDAEREACAALAGSSFTEKNVRLRRDGEPYQNGKMAIYAATRIAAAIRARA